MPSFNRKSMFKFVIVEKKRVAPTELESDQGIGLYKQAAPPEREDTCWHVFCFSKISSRTERALLHLMTLTQFTFPFCRLTNAIAETRVHTPSRIMKGQYSTGKWRG